MDTISIIYPYLIFEDVIFHIYRLQQQDRWYINLQKLNNTKRNIDFCLPYFYLTFMLVVCNVQDELSHKLYRTTFFTNMALFPS